MELDTADRGVTIMGVASLDRLQAQSLQKATVERSMGLAYPRNSSDTATKVAWRSAACFWLCTAILYGCSGRPSRVEPPKLNPDAAAADALASFDSNRDGHLDSEELRACPGLKAGVGAVDTDRDGNLSAKEIADRIQQWSENKVALVAVNCSVVKNGRPLSGATVTFVPEKFLGPNIKPASGVSDSTGRVELAVSGVPVTALAHCGFYRVEISQKDGEKEMIPTKFNRDTVLGEEIAEGDKKRLEGYVFDVSAR